MGTTGKPDEEIIADPGDADVDAQPDPEEPYRERPGQVPAPMVVPEREPAGV